MDGAHNALPPPPEGPAPQPAASAHHLGLGVAPAALRAVQLAKGKCRLAIIVWRGRAKEHRAWQKRNTVAEAICMRFRMELAMKWSFDRVLTLWRSHPRLLALAFTKQVALEMRHESRALLVWRRWSRASIVLEDAVYELVGQRERRLRAEALQPAVHRWRLRTQRELASAALETRFLWRSSASRAMRALRMERSARLQRSAERHAAQTVALALALRAWGRGSQWSAASAMLLGRALFAAVLSTFRSWRRASATTVLKKSTRASLRAASALQNLRRLLRRMQAALAVIAATRRYGASLRLAAQLHLAMMCCRRAMALWAVRCGGGRVQLAARAPVLATSPLRFRGHPSSRRSSSRPSSAGAAERAAAARDDAKETSVATTAAAAAAAVVPAAAIVPAAAVAAAAVAAAKAAASAAAPALTAGSAAAATAALAAARAAANAAVPAPTSGVTQPPPTAMTASPALAVSVPVSPGGSLLVRRSPRRSLPPNRRPLASPSLLSPMVARIGSLFSRRRKMYYAFALWLAVRSARRKMLRFPRWGKGLRRCLLREGVASWRGAAIDGMVTDRLLAFAARVAVQRALTRSFLALRAHTAWRTWVPKVFRALAKRRKHLALRQWRTHRLGVQRGRMLATIAAHAERVRSRRALLRWSRAHWEATRRLRSADVRDAAAGRLHAVTAARRALRYWRHVHKYALRAIFLPPPPLPPPPKPPHLKHPSDLHEVRSDEFRDERRLARGEHGVTAAAEGVTAAEAPQPPTAFSSPRRGGYNSRRHAAAHAGYAAGSEGAAPASGTRLTLITAATHPHARHSQYHDQHHRAASRSGAARPGSRLRELQERHRLRFRWLWDGRQACRRWQSAVLMRSYLGRREAAAMGVAASHAAAGGLGARARARHAMQQWFQNGCTPALMMRLAEAYHGSKGGRGYARRVRSVLVALQAAAAGGQRLELADLRALATYAPHAPLPLPSSMPSVPICVACARLFARWELACRASNDRRRMVGYLLALPPFSRSHMCRFVRRLRLAAALGPKASADAPRAHATRQQRRALEQWSRHTWLGAAAARQLALTLESQFRRAFHLWQTAAIDRSLSLMCAASAKDRATLCARAIRSWLRACVDIAATRACSAIAEHLMRSRALSVWGQRMVAWRLEDSAQRRGRSAVLASALPAWRAGAAWCGRADADTARAEARAARSQLARGMDGLVVASIASARQATAVAVAGEMRMRRAWTAFGLYLEYTAWANLINARGKRILMRVALRSWSTAYTRMLVLQPSIAVERGGSRDGGSRGGGSQEWGEGGGGDDGEDASARGAGRGVGRSVGRGDGGRRRASAAAVRKWWKRSAAMPDWREVRTKLISLEVGFAFDALAARATLRSTAAAAVEERRILSSRLNLRAWRERCRENAGRAQEAAERYSAARSLLMAARLARWGRRARELAKMRSCVALFSRSHGARECAWVLRAWLAGVAAAEASAAVRASAAIGGRAWVGLCRWRRHARARRRAADTFATGVHFASAVSAPRLNLRKWRHEITTRMALEAVLDQRTRLVHVALRIPWLYARWARLSREARAARRLRLASGWRRYICGSRDELVRAGGWAAAADHRHSVTRPRRLSLGFERWRVWYVGVGWVLFAVKATRHMSDRHAVSSAYDRWKRHATRRHRAVERQEWAVDRGEAALLWTALMRWAHVVLSTAPSAVRSAFGHKHSTIAHTIVASAQRRSEWRGYCDSWGGYTPSGSDVLEATLDRSEPSTSATEHVARSECSAEAKRVLSRPGHAPRALLMAAVQQRAADIVDASLARASAAQEMMAEGMMAEARQQMSSPQDGEHPTPLPWKLQMPAGFAEAQAEQEQQQQRLLMAVEGSVAVDAPLTAAAVTASRLASLNPPPPSSSAAAAAAAAAPTEPVQARPPAPEELAAVQRLESEAPFAPRASFATASFAPLAPLLPDSMLPTTTSPATAQPPPPPPPLAAPPSAPPAAPRATSPAPEATGRPPKPPLPPAAPPLTALQPLPADATAAQRLLHAASTAGRLRAERAFAARRAGASARPSSALRAGRRQDLENRGAAAAAPGAKLAGTRAAGGERTARVGVTGAEKATAVRQRDGGRTTTRTTSTRSPSRPLHAEAAAQYDAQASATASLMRPKASISSSFAASCAEPYTMGWEGGWARLAPPAAYVNTDSWCALPPSAQAFTQPTTLPAGATPAAGATMPVPMPVPPASMPNVSSAPGMAAPAPAPASMILGPVSAAWPTGGTTHPSIVTGHVFPPRVAAVPQSGLQAQSPSPTALLQQLQQPLAPVAEAELRRRDRESQHRQQFLNVSEAAFAPHPVDALRVRPMW